MKWLWTIPVAIILLLPFAPARADQPCVEDYERQALPYWSVVDDILSFKTMFDNYDGLCAGQPFGSETALLRERVSEDAASVVPVMRLVFEQVLPSRAGENCKADSASRAVVERRFLQKMEKRYSTLHSRLKRSRKELSAAGYGEQICRSLAALGPEIGKILASEQSNPLLSATCFRGSGDCESRRSTLKIYRKAMNCMETKEKSCKITN